MRRFWRHGHARGFLRGPQGRAGGGGDCAEKGFRVSSGLDADGLGSYADGGRGRGIGRGFRTVRRSCLTARRTASCCRRLQVPSDPWIDGKRAGPEGADGVGGKAGSAGRGAPGGVRTGESEGSLFLFGSQVISWWSGTRGRQISAGPSGGSRGDAVCGRCGGGTERVDVRRKTGSKG